MCARQQRGGYEIYRIRGGVIEAPDERVLEELRRADAAGFAAYTQTHYRPPGAPVGRRIEGGGEGFLVRVQSPHGLREFVLVRRGTGSSVVQEEDDGIDIPAFMQARQDRTRIDEMRRLLAEALAAERQSSRPEREAERQEEPPREERAGRRREPRRREQPMGVGRGPTRMREPVMETYEYPILPQHLTPNEDSNIIGAAIVYTGAREDGPAAVSAWLASEFTRQHPLGGSRWFTGTPEDPHMDASLLSNLILLASYVPVDPDQLKPDETYLRLEHWGETGPEFSYFQPRKMDRRGFLAALGCGTLILLGGAAAVAYLIKKRRAAGHEEAVPGGVGAPAERPGQVQMEVTVRSQWEFWAVADLVRDFLRGTIPEREYESVRTRLGALGTASFPSARLHLEFPTYTADQAMEMYAQSMLRYNNQAQDEALIARADGGERVNQKELAHARDRMQAHERRMRDEFFRVDKQLYQDVIGANAPGIESLPPVDIVSALALNWMESRFQWYTYNKNPNGTYDAGTMEANVRLDGRPQHMLQDTEEYYTGERLKVSRSLLMLRHNAPHGCLDDINAAGMEAPSGHAIETLTDRIMDLHRVVSSQSSSVESRGMAEREWRLISAGRDLSVLRDTGGDEGKAQATARRIFNPFNPNQNISTSFSWVRRELAEIEGRLERRTGSEVSLVGENLLRYMFAVYNTGGPNMWKAIREAGGTSTDSVLAQCQENCPAFPITERDRSGILLQSILENAVQR